MTEDNPYHNESMWKGASPEIFRRAENLRKNPTKAEERLWKELQMEPFKKYHFRRQHPIHLFIADFYSHQLKLIIEVDGGYHASIEQQTRDQSRTDLLQFQNLDIIRFTNQQVLENIEIVLKVLAEKTKS